MTTHVFIATTQGPVAVQNVRQLDDSLMSSVCINGQAKEASISRPYYHFAKPGIGLVAEDFGKHVWRIDLSENIDEGSSWQLGVYLAHHFHQLGQLGNGEVKAGDSVVWATGEVSIDREVRAVEAIPKKVASSQVLWDTARKLGNEVTVIAPESNVTALTAAGWGAHPLLNKAGIQLVRAATVDDALRAFTSSTENAGLPTSPEQSTRPWRAWVAVAAVVLTAGYAANQYFNDASAQTGTPVTNGAPPPAIDPPHSADAPPMPVRSPDAPILDVSLSAHFAEPAAACPNPDDPRGPGSQGSSTQVALIAPSRFATVNLERLCWQILEVESGAEAVVAVSLRRAGAIRAQRIATNRWRIPAMSYRLAQREQAILLFPRNLSESEFKALSKALSAPGPGQLRKAGVLEKVLSGQTLRPVVFRQTLAIDQ